MTDGNAIARDDSLNDLLGEFLDESGQLLDRLNGNMLQLDQWVRCEAADDPPARKALLNEMFRSAHSLKGLSAMFGLEQINGLTHKIENVFDAARKDDLEITDDVIELVFQGIDRLVALVDSLKDPAAEPVCCQAVMDGIHQMLQMRGVARVQGSQADLDRAMSAAAAELDDTAAASPASPLPLPESSAPPPPCAVAPVAPAPTAAPSYHDPFEGLSDEAEISSRYLAIYIDEAEQSLDQVTTALLSQETQGDARGVELLLVTAHRIKGSSASIGLNRAAKLAHLMEDLLQSLRETGHGLTEEMIDALLQCTDELRQHVADLKAGTASADHFGDVARLLPPLVASLRQPEPAPAEPSCVAAAEPPTAAVPGSTSSTADTIPADFRNLVASRAPQDRPVYVGEVRFDPSLQMASLKAQLLYEKLCHLGTVCQFSPSLAELDEMDQIDQVWFGLASDEPIEEIRDRLRISGVVGVVVEPLSKEAVASVDSAAVPRHLGVEESASSVPAAGPALPGTQKSEPAEASRGRAVDGRSRPTETLRVDIDRLDHLMHLAGQLVTTRARFSQISDRLQAASGGARCYQRLQNLAAALGCVARVDQGTENPAHQLDELRAQTRRIQGELELACREVETLAQTQGTIGELFETVHQLDRVSEGIQQGLMDTRMVPIGPLFVRFHRVVRDITRLNGKRVRLEVRGEKTELDKRMIDELSDPLIHMVRNSADHGIELPEVRESLGKPAEGTITLDAFHRGNSIVIQVTDDGRGLDEAAIRRKCIEKGLLGPEEVDRLTRHQLLQMVWEPGFSTAEKVTEVSGRGMGMDIVKSKIEDLNGTIELDSRPGQGTTLTIKLPLTLAILPSLIVEIQGDIFAVPLESVEEIVSVGRRDLATIRGQVAARVRQRVVAVFRLDQVFDWSRPSKPGLDADTEQQTLVVIGEQSSELALAVDRVLGEEDVVIKSIADNYRNIPAVSGASILGDGRVSLILDTPALVELASRKTGVGGAVVAPCDTNRREIVRN